MSEQTPDTNNSVADGQDPSMEDILASIRKIIAEDDTQSENEPEALALDDSVDSVEADVVKGDIASLAHSETLDLDILAEEDGLAEPNIDALIGDMDDTSQDALAVPEIVPVEATAAATADTELDDILSLEIPMDESEATTLTETAAIDETVDLAEDTSLTLDDELADILAPLDDEQDVTAVEVDAPEERSQKRGFMGGAMAALGLGGAAVAAKSAASDSVAEPQDDLSLMLDNMLEDSSSYQEGPNDTSDAEQVFDPAEDLLAEIQDEEIEDIAEASPETDPDMDLVKSLMADLTEEPLHDEEAVEAETRSEVVDIDDDDMSEDIMDEILSMTIDDETKLSEEIAIPEISVAEDAPAEAMSLKDIAAAATADAQSSETKLGAGLAAAAAIGVAGTALATSEDETAEDTTETNEITNPIETPTPEHITEETPPMARAKKSDAIIDEVTESATAGAFASLTNVVEEKATVAERGDRIGDLVMEALQPMLKEWLDANLKGIVERAVTKEVKRISSGK